MKKDSDRLEGKAYELLFKSDQERIDFIYQDKWVGYPAAKKILAEMENLLIEPDRQRKRFMYIEAPSGNGKTTLLRRFLQMHPFERDEGGLRAPVIYVECPAGPSIDEFYGEILYALGAPMATKAIGKKFQLKMLLPRVKAKMLLIDNFHDFKFGNANYRKKFVVAVRKLATDTEINMSIVAAATYIGRNVIEGDRQTYSRFKFMCLPTWRDDNDFRNLLSTFERVLPLKKVSDLAADQLYRRILVMSEGILANIEEILQDAARIAIETGAERIDAHILKEIPFNSKHQRPPVGKNEYPEGY